MIGHLCDFRKCSAKLQRIVSHISMHGSDTAIQYHGLPQVVGMSYYIITEGTVQDPPFNIMPCLKLWVRVITSYLKP